MFNSNNDANSMLWLLILFMLAGNTNTNFVPPTNEEINKIMQNGIEKFLSDHKELVEKADADSPLTQLNTLYNVSKEIDNSETDAKVLGVAMSIMKNIETMNKYCCGGSV